MTEREKFEAWMKRTRNHLAPNKTPSGFYVDSRVDDMWNGWQARAQADSQAPVVLKEAAQWLHALTDSTHPKTPEMIAMLARVDAATQSEQPTIASSVARRGDSSFQARVQPWMLECFGHEIASDRIERNHRFFEEATEAVQANGMTRSEAHQLVDYTFDRPVGELYQEVGGVMVTLAAMCLASNQDMHACGELELARIWTKVEQIRAKQAAKPKHSPLPAEHSSVAHRGGDACDYPFEDSVQALEEHFSTTRLTEIIDRHLARLDKGREYSNIACAQYNAVQNLTNEIRLLIAAPESTEDVAAGEHRQGCEALGGYGHGVGPCTCSAAGEEKS